MKKILPFLIIVFTFSSCKKKEDAVPATATSPSSPSSTPPTPIDTIFPGNYYPVYPGSHWTYLINGTTTTENATGYTLYDFKPSTFPSCPTCPSIPNYIPFYDGTPYTSMLTW